MTLGKILWCFLAAVLIWVTGGYVMHHMDANTFKKQLKAYGFLSDYACWEDTFNVTLYTTDPAECSKKKSNRFFGITYSGNRAIPYRTVAVDPEIIPLGSILLDTETEDIFIAEDTGNEIKGKHIDLFIGQSTKKNTELMNKWGAKQRQFFIIETRKKDIHTFPFQL